MVAARILALARAILQNQPLHQDNYNAVAVAVALYSSSSLRPYSMAVLCIGVSRTEESAGVRAIMCDDV